MNDRNVAVVADLYDLWSYWEASSSVGSLLWWQSSVKTVPASYRVAVISMHEMYIVRLLLVCMDTSLIMTKHRPDTAIINYYKT